MSHRTAIPFKKKQERSGTGVNPGYRSAAAVLVSALVATGCGAPGGSSDERTLELTQALGSFTRQTNFDLIQLLRLGHVTATVNTTFDIGDINSMFDGDLSTLARTPGVNPLVVTLAFDASYSFNQTQLDLATDGSLTLEIANTLSDLNAKTGSYALAVNGQPLSANVFGMFPFSATGKYVRATITRTTGDDFVHVIEWGLAANVTVNDIKVFPSTALSSNTVKLLTGKSLQLTAKYADANGYLYPIGDAETWSSSNTGVLNVASGRITAGGTPGSATVTVTANGVSETASVTTQASFTQTRDASRTRKVALVLRDPPVPQHGNLPMHQVYGWNDPNAQVPVIISRLESSSANAVDFKVVETDNIGSTYLDTQFYGAELDFNTLIGYYDQGSNVWEPLLNDAASSGNLAFEYNKALSDFSLCEKRNAGLIDEVWVYTDPFGGMYESRLTGPDAFPLNSPPLLGTTCNGQLPIMGLNYEASTPNGVHSFGHRMEGAMAHATGHWSSTATNPNAWELFTTLDKDKPGQGEIGDTHFPVNGLVDYDYSNTDVVNSNEATWQYYPFLMDLTNSVSCNNWSCTDDGYYQFMFGHVPRFTGLTDGLLNNWWYYFADSLSAQSAAHDQVLGNVGNTTLGFETTSGWTSSVGTKSQDTTAAERTQGAASLKMTGIGAGVTLTSAALSSSAVSVANCLSVDVQVPTQLAGQTGAQVKLCLKSPQRGVASYVCSSTNSLDGVGVAASPTFYTVPWTLPAATLSALKAGSFTDLQIQVVLSGVPAPAQSATWLFDRMVFFGP
jgi:hypothetical protein